MVTGNACFHAIAQRLQAVCEDRELAQFEARQIVRQVIGTNPFTKTLTPEQIQQADLFLMQRLTGRPLQYVLGEWDFYGLRMFVGEGVLIPRPETELLAELGISFLKGKKQPILADLCAGSGCVGIAVCSHTEATGVAVEISADALRYTQKNIEYHRLSKRIQLCHNDVTDMDFAASQPLFDCILANPPYIPLSDEKQLQREVRFEPALALFGGEDGLDCYRKLIPLWGKKLKHGGMLAVEIGMGQADAVSALFQEEGFKPEIKTDYNGIERIVYCMNRE